MKRANFPHRKELKREEAKQRQAERNKRSHEEHLEHLDSFLGIGEGAQKERKRLLALIVDRDNARVQAGKKGKNKKTKKTEKSAPVDG